MQTWLWTGDGFLGRALTLGVAVGAAVLCVSCGEDSKDDPLNKVSGFCSEWAKRACSEPVQSNCAPGSDEECQNSQSNFCLDLVDEDLYTKAGAKACLEAVETAYRDGDLEGEEAAVVLELGGDCAGILTGEGEEGDSCMDDLDCSGADGLVCVRRLDEPSGSCRMPVEVGGGEDCDEPDAVCPSNSYCTEDRSCRAKQDEGEECSEVEPCKSGLNCVGEPDAGVSVCTEKLGTGDACESGDDCESGICRSGTSGMICALKIRLDIDEPICDDFR